MTSSKQSKAGSRFTPFKRVLAFALLALVTFSTTAEAVHQHGNLPGARPSSLTASIGDAHDSGSLLKNTQTGADCLICQLHQHLFATVLNRPPHIASPQTRHVRRQATTTSYLSQTDAPRRGRAPPISSQS